MRSFQFVSQYISLRTTLRNNADLKKKIIILFFFLLLLRVVVIICLILVFLCSRYVLMAIFT